MDELLSTSVPSAEAGPSALSFVIDADSGDLQALYEPAGAAAGGVARHVFDKALADAGYGDYHLDADSITRFLAASKTTKQALHAIVGKRRDAEFFINISDDHLEARLTLFPPQGGAPVGTAVEDALREKGIVHGIDHDALNAALAAGFCDNVVIASGTPPREGIPAHFECMLQDRQKMLEQLDEDAVIKYRDLGHLVLVQPGLKLMHRTAPVQGSNGIDIFGDVVFPQPLPAMEFGDAFAGAVTDPNDPDTLLAAIAGQPVVLESGVIVNPVIEVDNVDFSTGNIAFDGTVHVNGDIKAGMTVKVSGDVIVSGAMEAAEVEAGGNVAVAGGIIGKIDSRPGASGLPPDTARIHCKGSVQALFVEAARIEAGDSIVIGRSARQCELTALNDVVVGAGGSKIGQIIGGLTQAKHLVRVSVLGSSAGVKTRVQVGLDPYVDGDIAETKKTLEQKNSEFDRILQLTVFFRQNPAKGAGGVKEKVDITRERLLGEIDVLTTRLQELNENLQPDEDARVQVDKAIYFGTEIRVGNQVWQAPDDMKGSVIGLVDGRILTGLSARLVTRSAAVADAAPGAPKEPGGFG